MSFHSLHLLALAVCFRIMEVPHRKLSTTFVGQKVSAVKWIGGQQMGEKRLLTASWDDKVCTLQRSSLVL